MNTTLLMAALLVWEVVPADTGWLIASLVPTAIGVVVLVAVSVRMGQLGHRIPVGAAKEPGEGPSHADDDAHWKGGIIYVNRDDPAIFVPKRFGVGGTVNLAHPVTWVGIAGFIIVTVGVIVLTS